MMSWLQIYLIVSYVSVLIVGCIRYTDYYSEEPWILNLIRFVFAPFTFLAVVFAFDTIVRNPIRNKIWPEEHEDGTCRSWRHEYIHEHVERHRGTGKYINNVEITEKKWVHTIYTCTKCKHSYKITNQ